MSNATDITLDSIIQSPRARKALEALGWTTMADVEDKSYAELISAPGIGEGTVQAILQARGPSASEPEIPSTPEPTIEEGPHAIRLDSPYNELRIRINHSEEVRDGRRVRVKPADWVRFARGLATFTRENWAMHLFPFDRAAQAKWLRDDKPWRVEAVEYLKSLRAYKSGSFVILND